MSKHTSGPWVSSPEEHVHHICFNHGAGLCEIALVEPVESGDGLVLITQEQAEANARLIASAPEMYAALETILFAVEGDMQNNDGRIDFVAIRGLCRSVITKAGGRS